VLGVAGADKATFTRWAKLKALESCWGEENIKLQSVNTKKAVAKCQHVDTPELHLAPFRAVNKLVKNMVRLGSQTEDDMEEMEDFMKFYRFTQRMDMINLGGYDQAGYQDTSNLSLMEKMKLMIMMRKMRDHQENMDKFRKSQDFDDESLESVWSQMRFTREVDDSVALNDRLEDKLEGMMEEHVNKVSNMTCVLRELSVIDQYNNIDVDALKRDLKQYEMPSLWFEDKYEEILDSCFQVAESLPPSLQEEYAPSNYNGPLRNLGKIKSFMDCSKSARMKLCMYQDTRRKIEDNFGPMDELVEGLHNQLSEEQVFLMVNELLEGPEEEYM